MKSEYQTPSIQTLMYHTPMISKKSNWVWQGKDTVTYFRPTHGTARKRHRTSKTSKIKQPAESLFPSEIIAKLERATRTTPVLSMSWPSTPKSIILIFFHTSNHFAIIWTSPHQKVKRDICVTNCRQILSICDTGRWLQDQSTDLELSLLCWIRVPSSSWWTRCLCVFSQAFLTDYSL